MASKWMKNQMLSSGGDLCCFLNDFPSVFEAKFMYFAFGFFVSKTQKSEVEKIITNHSKYYGFWRFSMLGDIMNYVEKYNIRTSKNDGKFIQILEWFLIGKGSQNDVKIDEKINTNCLRNHTGKYIGKVSLLTPFGIHLGLFWDAFLVSVGIHFPFWSGLRAFGASRIDF